MVGESAILISPHSVSEMENAMLSLVKDKNLCDNLRQKGLKQAKKFSWKNSAAKLLKVIEKL